MRPARGAASYSEGTEHVWQGKVRPIMRLGVQITGGNFPPGYRWRRIAFLSGKDGAVGGIGDAQQSWGKATRS